MYRNKAVLSALAVACASVTLAACSSSSNAGAGGGTGGSTSAQHGGSSSTADSALLTEAQSKAKAAIANPAGLNITTPLTKKPPTGKLVVTLQGAVAADAVMSAASQQAAKSLGWTLKIVTVGTGPEDPIHAFETALTMHPDAIHYDALPTTLIKDQLAQAKAAGIAVIPDAITDPVTPPLVSNTLGGVQATIDRAAQVADYVAAKSGGKASVQMFTLPVFPILTAFDKGFTTELARVCPSCKVQKNPQQLSDIGTKTPTSVVSIMQKNPQTDWLIFSFGDLAAGVLPALKSAGLASKVTLGGVAPAQSTLGEMAQGQAEVWSGFSMPGLGWQWMDSLARYFAGDPQVDADTPNQLITPDNIKTIVTDPNGYYIGFSGYEAAFEKLWGLG